MPDAEILSGLLADEASALNYHFWLVVQLQKKFAVLGQAGADAVGLDAQLAAETTELLRRLANGEL